MATVTFHSIVCNNPVGTAKLDFISIPSGTNPVFGPSAMQANVVTNIGQSRTFTAPSPAKLTVTVNGSSSNAQQVVGLTPGAKNLTFSFPNGSSLRTYTVSCTVS